MAWLCVVEFETRLPVQMVETQILPRQVFASDSLIAVGN